MARVLEIRPSRQPVGVAGAAPLGLPLGKDGRRTYDSPSVLRVPARYTASGIRTADVPEPGFSSVIANLSHVPFYDSGTAWVVRANPISLQAWLSLIAYCWAM